MIASANSEDSISKQTKMVDALKRTVFINMGSELHSGGYRSFEDYPRNNVSFDYLFK